ncbi:MULTISPECIES: ATP-binding protein [Stenotrophomonas]|uniref:ATP-binding protein n=1 Tax=Stenotrophomonas TaxID=40323 RepID=UPI0018D4CA46|nr:ATP-binding protein [Stenotrophomonas sp.]MBH1506580.1 ATP-binding protein [Stenotrophomonas maltophilia]
MVTSAKKAGNSKKNGFPTEVSAAPNKDFFVEMLTRDIELGDAILDLLDNCVDGIVRGIKSKKPSTKPYSKYYANITINKNKFEIEDNCGGIPLELARSKAFHMGRPPGHSDDAATVGMYGIGMKRAIFKIGQNTEVKSRNGDDAFAVTISKAWLANKDEWNLPIRKVPLAQMKAEGTIISITDLRPEIARRFDPSKDSFVEDFSTFVSQHYSIIISKGFTVRINGVAVRPTQFRLLMNEKGSKSAAGGRIAPFVVETNIQGVAVTIAVGLYRNLPSEDEVEREQEERASKDDAGWTIVCNDRVVVYRDKTRLTGWGEAGVPAYHSQFIAISGIVVMQSTDLFKLPLTTTKRGIDPSSEVFSITKDFMREGIKYFTKFTNRWKRLHQDRDNLYKSSDLHSLDSIVANIPASDRTIIRASAKGAGGTKYSPKLPSPPTVEKEVRVTFFRPRAQIELLSMALFDEPNVSPSDVGLACFERVFEEEGQ